MRINSISFKNFKGIKNLKIQPNDKDLNIYGDNATGKTSIYDGFNWLLFDKDSSNKKDFGIKPCDGNGDVIHGLESEVEAVLTIDDSTFTLRKTYYEKWTKQRGSASATFTGHTTDYFINGVPAKKTEYDAKINSIAREDVFRLLTNSLYFNEILKWQERRDIALEVCGNATDQDVIRSNKKLAGLSEILGQYTIDDYKKIIASKRKKINEELGKIPVRIDELTNSMEEVEETKMQVEPLELAKTEKQQDLTRLSSGGEVAEKKKQLAELQTKSVLEKMEQQKKYNETLSALRNVAANKFSMLAKLERDKKTIEHELKNHKESGKELAKTSEFLRSKWFAEKGTTLEYSRECICPTCQQAIPDWQLEEAKEKAISIFNTKKAETLAEITSKGKDTKEVLQDLQTKINKLEEDLLKLDTEINKAAREHEAASIKVKEFESTNYNEPKVNPDEDKLKKEIDSLTLGTSEQKAAIEQDITNLSNLIKDIQELQAKKAANKRALERIKELEAKEKELAAEYEQLE